MSKAGVRLLVGGLEESLASRLGLLTLTARRDLVLHFERRAVQSTFATIGGGKNVSWKIGERVFVPKS